MTGAYRSEGRVTPEALEMGQRLRELRRERGVRQRDVAERLGITVGAYAHYETGRSRISSLDLRRLAASLGAPLPLLLRRLGIMEEEPNTPDVEQILKVFMENHPEIALYFARLGEYDADDMAELKDLLEHYDRRVRRIREQRQHRNG